MIVLVLNIVGWPVIHVLVSRWAFARSRSSFDPSAWLYRPRVCENSGRLYEGFFRVKKWKASLPDGAALMGNSFTKKSLRRRDLAYFEDFVRETCRGEWAHWTTMSFAPIFFLWNPPWASAVMLAYALLANLPCIVVQRYNRIVLTRILARKMESLPLQ